MNAIENIGLGKNEYAELKGYLKRMVESIRNGREAPDEEQFVSLLAELEDLHEKSNKFIINSYLSPRKQDTIGDPNTVITFDPSNTQNYCTSDAVTMSINPSAYSGI